jgi:hypothetical protein
MIENQTFVEPQQRQKCASRVEPRCTQIGSLNGKKNLFPAEKTKQNIGLKT